MPLAFDELLVQPYLTASQRVRAVGRKGMTMKKHGQHPKKDAKVSGGQGGFRLPPDVSFNKQPLSYGWAYVFRHRLLGELGRLVLQETGDGRTHLSFEVVGEPSDPMTAQRAAIFQPLG